MPARSLFIGLDAVDAFVLQRWCTDETLPWFAPFSRQAAEFRLANSLAVIGGGVWQELNTGRSAGRAGVFFPARQLRTGETAPRQLRKDEIDPRAFWTVASDGGKRVAVVDVPHSVPPRELNGVFVAEWGTHDRLWGEVSVPEELIDELRDRHGEYPLWTRPWPQMTTAICDAHDGSREQYEQLVDDLLAGIEKKTDLLLDVLGREEWDLFACAFSEGQCSGHQLWHLFGADAGGTEDRLASGIRHVYRALDASAQRLVDAAGPGATVCVVASHAFVDPTGGTQLIPEVLRRLEYGSGHGVSARARTRVPPVVRKLIRAAFPRRATAVLRERTGTLPRPLESPHARAVALDGDRCSWIRLNLEGREPYGSVKPGAEADEMLADIRAELLRLEHPGTGQPIVARVESAVEAFGSDHHPDVPDLIVNFRADLGRLEACRSSRVGLVEVPYKAAARRTGAHPPTPTFFWCTGSGIARPASPAEGRAVDLAPTILSLLGLPTPVWMDGSTLV